MKKLKIRITTSSCVNYLKENRISNQTFNTVEIQLCLKLNLLEKH